MSFTANALNTRGFVAASQYRIGSLINKLSDSGSASSHLKHVISVAMKGGKCSDFYSEKENNMQKSLSSLVQDKLLRNKETHRQMMSPADYKQRIFAELPLRAFNEKLITKDQLVPKGFFRMSANVFEYELKENTAPSAAIDSFIEGPSIVDTGTAVQAVFLKMIKDQIKEDRFDALFSRKDNRLQITQGGSLDVSSSVNLFTQSCHTLRPGMRCHFRGIPFYFAKHLNGAGSGLNAIMIQDNLANDPVFWSLGFKELMRSEQIDAHLVHRYNQKPEDSIFTDLMATEISEEEMIDALKLDVPDEYHEHLKHNFRLKFPVLSLEEARMFNIGYSGSQHADSISFELIDFVKSCSVKSIQSEGFVDQLRIKNIGVHVKGLSELPKGDALAALFQNQFLKRFL